MRGDINIFFNYFPIMKLCDFLVFVTAKTTSVIPSGERG